MFLSFLSQHLGSKGPCFERCIGRLGSNNFFLGILINVITGLKSFIALAVLQKPALCITWSQRMVPWNNQVILNSGALKYPLKQFFRILASLPYQKNFPHDSGTRDNTHNIVLLNQI